MCFVFRRDGHAKIAIALAAHLVTDVTTSLVNAASGLRLLDIHRWAERRWF